MKKSTSIAILAAASAFGLAQPGPYKPYSVSSDLHEIVNLKNFNKSFTLAADTRQLLQKNLFVVTPGQSLQLYENYGSNDYRDIPSFITADSALHLYHVFYDALLRQLESTALLKKLNRLTANMFVASVKQWQGAPPATKDAALRNVAFFGVASKLLANAGAMPPEAIPMVDGELALINAQNGFANSNILEGKIDYSQFIPRGHYTKSEELKKYFAAMTWLSTTIPLAKEDGTPAETGILQSMMMSDAAKTGPTATDWAGIYEPTTLFVGPSNMYSPPEFNAALATPGAVKEGGPAFQVLLDHLTATRQPLIVSKKAKTGRNPAVQFAFMGRRFIPDSFALQELTDENRIMPSGLDVMAVLGSKRAAEILDANADKFNPKSWPDYQPIRQALTGEFANANSPLWSNNLYGGWLQAIKSYLQPVPAGYPSFMNSGAWEDKRINTAMASWTELRHDTLLYGQQSSAEKGDGREEIPPIPGFVEPCPETFQTLLRLTKLTHSELKKRSILETKAGEQLTAFEDLLSFLYSIAKKEVTGVKVTKEEHEKIRYIEYQFEDPTTTMLQYGTNLQALSEDDLDMSLVADVHTGGNDALEEGIGRGDSIIVVIPVDGKLWLARGCVFSQYEFTRPISDRLSDPAWKAIVKDGKAPARPFWTTSYLSSSPLTEKD